MSPDWSPATLEDRLVPRGSGRALVFNARKVPTYGDLLRWLPPGPLGAPNRVRILGELQRDKMLKSIHPFKNLIVNAGLNYLVTLVTTSTQTAFVYVGVGSGTLAPAAGDTDLQTVITPRQAVTSGYNGGTGIAKWDTFFSTTMNAGTWNEGGLFTTVTVGTMGSRALFSPAVTKSASNTVLQEWQWTF